MIKQHLQVTVYSQLSNVGIDLTNTRYGLANENW